MKTIATHIEDDTAASLRALASANGVSTEAIALVALEAGAALLAKSSDMPVPSRLEKQLKNLQQKAAE